MRSLLLVLGLVAGCLAPAGPSVPAEEAALAGIACPDPCRILVAPGGQGTREPHLAVDPLDPRHLLAASMTFEVTGEVVGRLHLQVHESLDGGAAWTTRPFALAGASPASETFNAAVAFLPDGTPLLAGVALEGAYSPLGPAQGRAKVFVARGPALDEVAVLAEGTGAEVPALGAGVALTGFDKPSLAVGADAVHAAWSVRERATPADAQHLTLALASSRDGGRTWQRADAPAFDGDVVSGPGAVTRSGAAVFPVATFDGPTGASARDFRCALLVLVDGGSWEERPLGACAWVPAVAVHGDEVQVALATKDATVLRASGDLGRTWGRDVVLDTAEAEGATVPTVAALEDGRSVATFFHPLREGTSYRAVVVDGLRASPPIVLDAAISREPKYLGNYFGLVPVPTGAVATWVSEEGDVTAVASASIEAP